MPLSQGKSMRVDRDDLARIQDSYKSLHAVNYRGYWYAHGSLIGGGAMLVHRFLAEPSALLVVDHINGDGLDNRRANLRVCTRGENARNRRYQSWSAGKSGFRGVTWKSDIELWEARVGAFGKRYGAGLYETEEDAARAYDWLAGRLHRDFAVRNLPDEPLKAPSSCCPGCLGHS